MRLPVFQLSYALNQDPDRKGLCFPAEALESDQPGIFFAIPILIDFDAFWGLPAYLNEHLFYFAMSVKGQYTELTGRLDFPNLIFEIPGTKQQIFFEIDLPPFFPPPVMAKNRLYHYYSGNHPAFQQVRFLTLTAISLLAMDDLCLGEDVVFVGYTPEYGEINLQYFLRQG